MGPEAIRRVGSPQGLLWAPAAGCTGCSRGHGPRAFALPRGLGDDAWVMGRRLTILFVLFGLTAGATIAALILWRNGTLASPTGGPPPKGARYGDPTLAAARHPGDEAKDEGRPGKRPDHPRDVGERHRDAHEGARPDRAAPATGLSHDIGSIMVTCHPACRVYVDGRLVAHSPPAKPVVLPVGSHHLRVVDAAGHAAKRLVLVAPDRINRITMTIAAGPKPVKPFRDQTGTEGW